MEKITLTQAQADSIKRTLEDFDIVEILNIHAERGEWLAENKPLNDLSQADMARALLIGYDVQPEYKVGDWVARTRTTPNTGSQNPHFAEGYIFKITDLVSDKVGDGICLHLIENIRHATPEEIKAEQERRAWKRIGREPGEFVSGDTIQISSGCTFLLGAYTDSQKRQMCIDQAETYYDAGRITGFYPRESFISFGGESDE